MGGSRDARPGDAADGEGDADKDRGDEGLGAPGADAKLTAMRAVWLTMRAEEPSSGGLAELLAAARTKAAELQPRPRWWQRVAAALRRPPVFALATALVVLGGALVVGRNAKRASPSLEVSSAGSAGPGAAAGPTTLSLREESAQGRRAGEGGRAAELSAVGRLDRTAAAPVVSAPAVSPPSAHPRSSAVAPARTAGDEKPPVDEPAARARGPSGHLTGGVASPAQPATDADQATRPGGGTAAAGSAGSAPSVERAERPVAVDHPGERPAASADEAPGGRAGGATEAKLERADDSNEPTARAPGPTKPARPARREAPVAPKGVGAGSDTAGVSPAGAALYEACEAAASRGDCASVRRIVERISTTDRGYRARLARGSAVAKCLDAR